MLYPWRSSLSAADAVDVRSPPLLPWPRADARLLPGNVADVCEVCSFAAFGFREIATAMIAELADG